MLRLLTALLILITMLSAMALLSSCGASVGSGDAGSSGDKESEINGNNGGGSSGEIIIPESDSFSKNAVNFNEIVYSMPDIQEIHDAFDAAINAVEDNSTLFDEQLEKVKAAQGAYDNFITMYTYLQIMIYQNAANQDYTEEFEILSSFQPTVAQHLEIMLVAAARSPHAVRFESEYYGSGLINRYREGGVYTDDTVALMEDEAKLIAEYAELSGATVTVYYDGITDTYDNTLERLKGTYGEGTAEYIAAKAICDAGYKARLRELSADILVSLMKVRKKISDHLGYSSYTEYAYATVYHDYSVEHIDEFIQSVANYMVPVYNKSYIRVLKDYVHPTVFNTDKATLLNTLGKVLEGSDSDLYDAYSFMLSYGLFDIGAEANNRYSGAFTAYLEKYDSPYLFATVDGSVDGYLTVAHEFGHFYDMFVNWGSETSMDLNEVSSQALELLILTRLDDHLSSDEYKYLYHSALNDLMSTMIMQSFYARFEHLAYSLPYYEITTSNLENCARKAAEDLSLNPDRYGNLSAVSVPQIYYQPFYVQSYSTSAAVALDIFFAEMKNEGSGFEIYEKLTSRRSAGSFNDHLTRVSLQSPFNEKMVKRISDSSHYYIFGSHYYDEYKNSTVKHPTLLEFYSLPPEKQDAA